MEIAIELVIAVLGIIVSSAISDSQMKDQEKRQARETFIRHMYQAIKNRFGIAIDQLNQVAEKLGIRLNQLTESARGSARLSTATKIYRDFIQQYPESLNKINNAKNVIQNEINNLDAKENAAASKIEKREDVSNQEILQDAVGSIGVVNDAITNSGQDTSTIDTGLISKEIENDKTQGINATGNSIEDRYSDLARIAQEHPGEDPRRLSSGSSSTRNH